MWKQVKSLNKGITTKTNNRDIQRALKYIELREIRINKTQETFSTCEKYKTPSEAIITAFQTGKENNSTCPLPVW